MAEERFQDKQLAKKTDAKIKGEDTGEKANPHEQAKNIAKSADVKADAKTEAKSNTEATAKKTEKPAATPSKEEKPAKKFVLERKYTVNLTDAYAKPKYHRADKAISLLRAFCLRHMKGKQVKVDTDLNNAIRTSSRPQKKVEVLLQKDDTGTVMVSLAQKTGPS